MTEAVGVVVVCYNVHCWKTIDRIEVEKKMISKFNQIQPDIICLQEVLHPYKENTEGLSPLDIIANNLGMRYIFKTPKKNGRWGSAILTRFGILSTYDTLLWPEQRVMISIHLSISENLELYVHNIHLDNVCEDTRLLQLNTALSNIDSTKPHLIMGDFNSLDKSDYTEERWNEIISSRQSNFWEEPMSKVTDKMKVLGYKDTWNLAKQRNGSISTCWTNTRVDYVYLSQSLMKENSIQVTSCDHEDIALSDHSPVIVRLHTMV